MKNYLHFAFFSMLLGIFGATKNVSAQPQCPPATGVSASPTMTCIGNPITLNATLPAGTTTLNWYTTPTGGTPIATTTLSSVNYTPTATGNFNYYVETVGGGGGPAVQNFTYTGAVQQVTLQPGSYEIETWGGNGHNSSGNNGKGGYAKGNITVTSPQTYYIYVGGLGVAPTSIAANTWTFNGGGTGHPANNNSYGNGGGASDVRTTGGTWDNAGSLAARIIVAGGGGSGSASYPGGIGGGLTGGNGTYFTPDQTGGPTGGTQTAGGQNTGYNPYCTASALGKAMTWNGVTIPSQPYMAGGGGGYYGGASGRVAGGGGSSYTGGVTAGVTIMSGQTGYVTSPSGNGNGYVRITGAGVTCTASQRVGTNTVSIGTPPVVDLGPDLVECQAQQPNVTLNAGNPGATFKWDDNSNAQTRSVTQTGTYYVEVTNSFGCTVADSVHVSLGTYPVVELGPSDTFFCADSLILNAGNPGSQYLWQDNSTSQKFIVDTSGTYYVAVTNQDGCNATDTISVNIMKPPTGYFDMNNWGGYNNPTYTFVAHMQNVTSFFWDFGDGSPTSTNNPVNHTYMTMGTYTAKLHITNDCETRIIEAKPQEIKVGINDVITNFNLSIYPNPAHQIINVVVDNDQIIEQVGVSDALGRIILLEKFNQNHVKLDVSQLIGGVYSISVKTNKGVSFQKINIISQ